MANRIHRESKPTRYSVILPPPTIPIRREVICSDVPLPRCSGGTGLFKKNLVCIDLVGLDIAQQIKLAQSTCELHQIFVGLSVRNPSGQNDDYKCAFSSLESLAIPLRSRVLDDISDMFIAFQDVTFPQHTIRDQPRSRGHAPE